MKSSHLSAAMMTQKFNLTWNKFQTHNNDLLSELYSTSSFADVTVICDDQTQFKAHKFVLSACSSVFRKILSDNVKSPYIYFPKVAKEEMESIFQFMYLGEVSLYKERMKKFLTVAKDLDIKEFGKIDDEEEDKKDHPTIGGSQIHNSWEDSIIKSPILDDLKSETKTIVTTTTVDTIDERKYECKKCQVKYSQYSGLYHHNRSHLLCTLVLELYKRISRF